MRLFATVLAIASGLIVLLGYFYPVPLLLELRLLLTNWAMIIAAMAVLIGIYNLVAVHMEQYPYAAEGRGLWGSAGPVSDRHVRIRIRHLALTMSSCAPPWTQLSFL